MVVSNDNTVKKGPALPILRRSAAYFVPKSDLDLAWSDLLRVLFTPRGTCPMNRRFGSGLYHLLFNQHVQANDPLITFTILSAAEEFCPHVRISGVQVQSLGARVQVLVEYGLANQTGSVVRGVDLPRLGDVRALEGSSV